MFTRATGLDASAQPPRLHHDPTAGRTVFVAPARVARPHDADRPAEAAAGDAPREWCPFCVGNEARTPPAVLRCPADAAVPWQARIVPNLYPFATEVGVGAGGSFPRAAHGVHDVVIESARHARSVLAVEPGRWRDVWELCRARIAAFAARGDLAWATVFKNSGPRAGASLEHLHSQLVGLDFVPQAMLAELAAVARMPGLFSQLVADAAHERRIVAEAADLVLLVPPAPRQPFEAWIIPRSPEPFFHAAAPARVAAVADLTRSFVARLERLVPAADFNWWLHQFPFAPHAAGLLDAWHWHVEILPRLSSFAGFELATGCHITTLSPAESAAMLVHAGD